MTSTVDDNGSTSSTGSAGTTTPFHIVLLDGSRLEFALETKMYVMRLLDMVAAQIGLKEKDYFGLAIYDDTGQCLWLKPDHKLVEHDIIVRPPTLPIILHFLIRFYVPSISAVTDTTAVRLLFLGAKQSIQKGQLECDIETLARLCALSLQAVYGDYTSDFVAIDCLKNLNMLPAAILVQQPSVDDCRCQTLDCYKNLVGMSSGSAVVTFLSEVEKLESYGVHYYEVKNKKGLFWLGISWSGIGIYDYANKQQPKKLYAWKQLENLFYHEKKFSIEVLDSRVASGSQPVEEGPLKVRVHTWSAGSCRLANTIWSTAVAQHQFYLDCKHNKNRLVRSLTDIAADLNNSVVADSSHCSDVMTAAVTSPQSVVAFPLEPRPSLIDTPENPVVTDDHDAWLTAKKAEALKQAKQIKFNELKARKAELEEKLKLKLEELYEVCLNESALTGVLPDETPRIAGKPTPTIRRRVGTKFSFSPKFLSPESGKLSALELEFEILQKQSEAALRLSEDKMLARNVRRKHRQTYRDTHHKLKEMEEKLNMYRRKAGRSLINIPDSVIEDFSEDSQEFLDIGDPEDLVLTAPHHDHPDAESESNTSELSYASEPRNRSHTSRMQRSQSSTPLQSNQLHSSESMPKMEIHEYDRPLTLRAPVRSVSSTSLKDPNPSPDLVGTADIKIYPKMVPQRSSHMQPMRATYQMGQNVPNYYEPASVSQLMKTQQRRKIRVPSSPQQKQRQQQHPPSPAGSTGQHSPEYSDTCSTTSQTGSLGAGYDTKPGSRRTSNGSTSMVNASAVASHTAQLAMQNGGVPLEPYEERTSTWPRKRGGRNSKNRQVDEKPVGITAVTANERSDSAAGFLELSPSKYGSKRDENDTSTTPTGYGTVFSHAAGASSDENFGRHRDERLAGISGGVDDYGNTRHHHHRHRLDGNSLGNLNTRSVTPTLSLAEQLLTPQCRVGDREALSSVRYTPPVDGNRNFMESPAVRYSTPRDVEPQKMMPYGTTTPLAGNSFPSTPSARYSSTPKTYGPNLSGHPPPQPPQSQASSVAGDDRHAVDVLFDSLWSGAGGGAPAGAPAAAPYAPAYSPPSQLNVSMSESVMQTPTNSRRRLKTSQSSFAVLPNAPRQHHHHQYATMAPSYHSGHAGQQRQQSVWPTGGPNGPYDSNVEIHATSTIV